MPRALCCWCSFYDRRDVLWPKPKFRHRALAVGDIGKCRLNRAISNRTFDIADKKGQWHSTAAYPLTTLGNACNNDLCNYRVRAAFGAVYAMDTIGGHLVASRGLDVLDDQRGLCSRVVDPQQSQF